MTSAADFVPPGAGLDGLREAALGCRGCELYQGTTQTVFSKGPESARLVLVGEQPGDIEDRRGEPFVGPAGKLLDRAVEEAGLDPAQTYTTNAVKHFKFRSDGPGKRRIHETPDAHDVGACRPWLLAEFALLAPDVVVALGATAGKALFGAGVPGHPLTRRADAVAVVRRRPGGLRPGRSRTTAPGPRRTRWRPCTPLRCCGRTTETRRTPAWWRTWQIAASALIG